VDRSLHISLAGMEAIHQDWIGGVRMPARPGSLPSVPGQTEPSDPAPDLTPRSVTAVLVGLKTRAAVFSVQRFVADYPDEPLMGVLPGVALDELWQVVGLAERALQGVSALVAVVSLAGLMAVILAGLNERRRELAILRAVGCGPRRLLGLLALEGVLVTALGVLLGALAAWGAAALLADLVQRHWGLPLRLAPPAAAEWTLMGAVLAGGWLASLVPGWRAYRLSLADGLSPRA
jgi:putative ABC transport system permease protein